MCIRGPKEGAEWGTDGRKRVQPLNTITRGTRNGAWHCGDDPVPATGTQTWSCCDRDKELLRSRGYGTDRAVNKA